VSSIETSRVSQIEVRNRRATLAVIAGGNFVQLGCRFLVGAVVPLLLVSFGTTRSTVGLALTGMWAVYALFQFPSGVLADRYGERSVVVLALGATALGVLAVAASPSVAPFAAFVIVLGAGTGTFFAPASSFVSRLYADRGTALGVLTASGAVAGVLFPAVGGFVGVRYGWRPAVALGSAAVVAVLVATLVVVPAVPAANPARELADIVAFDRHRELLSRPEVDYSIAVAISVGFCFQAVSSFFPTFLVEYHGLGPDVAGVVFGIVFGLSSIAQPVAGRLSDRYSRDLAIGASAGLALVGVATLLAAPTPAGLVVGVGVLGVGISWPGPVQARFFDQLAPAEQGYGFGLVRTVYMFGASSGSVVVGVLADVGGWVAGFGAVVTAFGCCLVLLAINRALSLGL